MGPEKGRNSPAFPSESDEKIKFGQKNPSLILETKSILEGADSKPRKSREIAIPSNRDNLEENFACLRVGRERERPTVDSPANGKNDRG